MGTRIALLLSLSWIMRLTEPLFSVLGNDISGRDLILFGGGLFLLCKSVHEIHDKLEGEERRRRCVGARAAARVLRQRDHADRHDRHRVLARLGDHGGGHGRRRDGDDARDRHRCGRDDVRGAPISEFVDAHPTIKMLALAFLLLIGMTLIAEGFERISPRATSTSRWRSRSAVEMLNIRMRKNASRCGCARTCPTNRCEASSARMLEFFAPTLQQRRMLAAVEMRKQPRPECDRPGRGAEFAARPRGPTGAGPNRCAR